VITILKFIGANKKLYHYLENVPFSYIFVSRFYLVMLVLIMNMISYKKKHNLCGERPMKRLMQLLFLGTLSIVYLPTNSVEDFDITIKSKWCDLDGNCTKSADFGGKWILVGSITFKKRSKSPIFIENITLHWNGDALDNLVGSLYKKSLDKDFLPIEANLICDGLWNKNKQRLILNFDEKENLGPTTIFYLVLTIPESIEPVLKKGFFYIEEQCLPKAFKHCAHDEKLSLAINDKTTKNTAASTVN